ncbi:MAG: LptA/OstA family protein [Candidatus Binataceae bacterium]
MKSALNTLRERRWLLFSIFTACGGAKVAGSTIQPSAAQAPRNGVRIAAGRAGAICPFLVAVLALNALSAGPPGVGAPPIESKASPVKQKDKNKGGAAAGDTKGGSQSSPFGMLKFSADNGPIQIKADSLNLDYKANSVEFTGSVHAAQSGTTLTSKSLKVIYGEKFGDIKEVVAIGDVKMMQGGRWATGQRAVLDEVKHTVEMTGQPVIHDGPDQVAGRRIIIYLDSEKSFVEGATAVIFPRASGKNDQQTAD